MAPDLTSKSNGDGTVTVNGICKVTQEPYSVIADVDSLRAYLAGEHAQRAFPKMSKEEREFLISGISPKGWIQMFGDGGEDE